MSDPDTILLIAILAVLLLGLGSLVVGWRASAAADRARAALQRVLQQSALDRKTIVILENRLELVLQGAARRGWSGLADETTDPEITRNLYRTPRDAT